MAESQPANEPTYSYNAVHLMRTTQAAHMQLSAMADQKASILMGATFVIFTIAIGQARGSVAPIPLLILGAAAFFSAICAVLAILPHTRQRRPTGTLNILFFGAFTQLSEEEFTEELMSRLRSDDSLYRTMARDIYQNGVVLQTKKYRLLGLAYRIFLVGLTASFGAFVAQYFFT
jgi:hypothetical protein